MFQRVSYRKFKKNGSLSNSREKGSQEAGQLDPLGMTCSPGLGWHLRPACGSLTPGALCRAGFVLQPRRCFLILDLQLNSRAAGAPCWDEVQSSVEEASQERGETLLWNVGSTSLSQYELQG